MAIKEAETIEQSCGLSQSKENLPELIGKLSSLSNQVISELEKTN